MTFNESFNQISPSEFFYRNRDLAGFSNPTRSIYTSVRELVENSLDACDQNRILPNIYVTIQPTQQQKSDPKHYILTVDDNGPGIDHNHIPLAFGTVLYGSKFGLNQARGMFGLGATMAILYGQITTNKPVRVNSSIDGSNRHEYEILLDIQKNKPIIIKHSITSTKKKGLSISICLEGDYSKAGSKIRDYIYQTSLITPYASIKFHDPKGNKYNYERITKFIPSSPTIIKPHPYGIDVETLRRMISDTSYKISNVDNLMIARIKNELKMRGDVHNNYVVMKQTIKKRWPYLSSQTKTILSILLCLKLNFNQLVKIKIESIDIARNTLTYWNYEKSKSFVTQLNISSFYYKHLANEFKGDTLETFLTKQFQRVGRHTAEKFTEFAHFRPGKRIMLMTNQELVHLSDSLQKFSEFLSPDPSCLAPLGENLLEKGIAKFFNPDFVSVVQRKASAYSGFPFIVEMGVAYGGSIVNGIKLYRFANRIPLLYDESSDVVFKVINDIDWNRYKIKNESPLVIISHICSTRIPYKTVGKENVADRNEIERELKLALQFLSRKLSSYMSKKGKAAMEKKRVNLYFTYMPLIARFCTELSEKLKEPNYKKIFNELK
ncbi:MAG: DNA topoisomerase VI subunit B [Thaumarchaeota archaeon]|nr:DNA topoisomerase VI subunit B [Nitrososphaerota archaeon]MCY3976295.1 DNA topoisomerase VI subunit B [Nitrososphaerota archaeon]